MTVVNVERSNDYYKSVLTEMLTVTKNYASYVAYAESVNKHLACLNGRKLLHIILVDFDNTADISDKYILSFHSQILGKLCVLLKVLLLAVNGNKVFRLDKAVDNFKLLLTGVSRNVNVVH